MADKRPALFWVEASLAFSARLMTRAAALALVFMMLVTLADIVLRQSVNLPVFGNVELVQLALVVVVYLALPETFLRGDHVTVDVIDLAIAPWGRALLRTAAAALTLVFLLAMAWRMVFPALDTLEFGDSTMDLGLPLIWYWVPMILGVAFGAAGMCLVLVRETLRIFTGGAPPGAAFHDA